MSAILNFKVGAGIIRCTSNLTIPANTVKHVKAKFIFEEDWNPYSVKIATFTNESSGYVRRAILNKDNLCVIPWEVLAGGGTLTIDIEGRVTLPDDTSAIARATTQYTIRLIENNVHSDDSEDTITDTPDILTKTLENIELIDQYAAASQSAKENAQRAEESAKVAEENAKAAEASAKSLPVAFAGSSDGIAYTAADATSTSVLPMVKTGSEGTRIGKGRQIVFVPNIENTNDAPTLQINEGEIIPIRQRAPVNQSNNSEAPDATLPIPAGTIMKGVPYTLSFCGKYWLIDQVAQYSCAEDKYQAAAMRKIAAVAADMLDDTILGVPIINSAENTDSKVTVATILRSVSEKASLPRDGSVQLPTEQRVGEMICRDMTTEYAGWTPTSDIQKTVENYAKTLADGRYRVVDDAIGRYEMEIFTVVNGQQYRIIREYTDECCYISFYCGDATVLYIDTEVGEVQVGSRTMITNDNIPLPTTADVGKVLVASAQNSAIWMAVENAEEVAF